MMVSDEMTEKEDITINLDSICIKQCVNEPKDKENQQFLQQKLKLQTLRIMFYMIKVIEEIMQEDYEIFQSIERIKILELSSKLTDQKLVKLSFALLQKKEKVQAGRCKQTESIIVPIPMKSSSIMFSKLKTNQNSLTFPLLFV